jgi:glutamate racemase
MKLGIFDSGLGGLLITKAIRQHIPDIDILYLGDTLHLPYGNRSEEAIYTYTERCIDYLFKQDCQLIVVACNTASASALRKLQQGYLIKNYPDRRILGVVVPTLEATVDKGHENLGLIGTNYTVKSNVYKEELRKINPAIELTQINTPLLVPLIEYDGMNWVDSVLEEYMKPLMEAGVESLILSCTHYVCLKDRIRARYGIDVFSQDEIIPEKLADYLNRHPEISDKISRNSEAHFMVTDCTDNYRQAAQVFYGPDLKLETARVHGYD